MSKVISRVVAVFTGLLFGTLAFGQEPEMVVQAINLAPLGASVAIGLAAYGAASGQGRTVAAALEGLSRNPQAKDAMNTPMILGLVFMEFQALLGFVIAYLLLN